MENSKEETLKSVEDFKQENLAPIHGNQNEITYCDICIEKFENSEGLKNHISIVHNGNNEQENLILDHDNILIEECMTRKPIILLNKDKLLDKMAENCEVTISNKIFKKLITKALMGDVNVEGVNDHDENQEDENDQEDETDLKTEND